MKVLVTPTGNANNLCLHVQTTHVLLNMRTQLTSLIASPISAIKAYKMR